MQSRVILSFFVCLLAACGSSEAPGAGTSSPAVAADGSSGVGDLPEWQNDAAVTDDAEDGSTAAPEDVAEQDTGVAEDVVEQDTDDTDSAAPADIDDDASQDTLQDDATVPEDAVDDTTLTPDTVEDTTAPATCAGVPIDRWRCPDGELVDHCACTDDVLVCEEDPFYLCTAAECWDGQPLTCRTRPPTCPEGQQVTLQEGCWRCVDPVACVPPEISCLNNGGICGNARIGCGPDAAVTDALECQFSGTGAICCLPGRNTSCDDDSDEVCDRIPPICDDTELLAIQRSCYACVNPATCVP